MDSKLNKEKVAAKYFTLVIQNMRETNKKLRNSKYASINSVFPPANIIEDCVAEVKSYLTNYMKVHNVHQKSPDLFKLTAWLGMSFAKHFKQFDVRVPVYTLQGYLRVSSRKLPTETIEKICHLVEIYHDKNLTDYSLGPNGLYMVFKACNDEYGVKCIKKKKVR